MASRQHGAALLLLAAILVLGVSWMMVTAIGNAAQRSSAGREHNARVMAEAKAALIGWIAMQALDNSEQDPGRLPCPQNWGDVGTSFEGRAGSSCGSSGPPAVPAVGWLPWRTLGLPKLLDASGNQFWYVVSPGWHLAPTTTNLSINSNSTGQLVAGSQAAVALIIAPGPAINVSPNTAQSAAGCSARNQTRNLLSPSTTDVRDYLECQNATTSDSTFATTVVDNGASPVFNDQVLVVTAADILPVLEASIAKRIERDIVPSLKDVYASSSWASTVSSSNPLLPFAATFDNPSDTNHNFKGVVGQASGLLPFNETVGCTGARCDTNFITFVDAQLATAPTTYKASGYGSIMSQSCSLQSSATRVVCQGQYLEDGSSAFTLAQTMRIELSVTLKNVALGFRTIDTAALATKMTVEARNDSPVTAWEPQSVTIVTQRLNPDGSMTLTFGASLPNIDAKGWGTFADFRVTFDRTGIFGDHSLLSSTNATTGWFVRNEWYRLLYYAVATGHTPSGLTNYAVGSGGTPTGSPATPDCTTGSTCLSVTNMDAPSDNKRSILVLAGRSINGQSRPGAPPGPTDYLEQGNATGAYVKLPVSPAGAFNDRIVVVDAKP